MDLNITEKEASDMDKIVSYLISYNNFGEVGRFHDEVLQNEEKSYIEGLVDNLISYGNKIIILAPQSGHFKFIRSGTSAPNFMSKGGFTGIVNKQKEEMKKQAEVSKLEFENLELSVNKLKNELSDYSETKQLAKNADKTGKDSLNVSKWSMRISLLSLLIILITILLTRYKIWPFDK